MILLALLLAVQALAATPNTSNDLAVARAALRDGLWEIARHHVAGETNAAARAVILESHAQEGAWNKVSAALSSWGEPKGAIYDYYRAAAKGDAHATSALLTKTGVAAAIAEARMLQADVARRAGDRTQAERLWRETAADTNASARAFTIAAANLNDAALLRRAYREIAPEAMRAFAGLRLGRALLADAKTREEGEKLIRAIAHDTPDANGADEAMLAVADAELAAKNWQAAADAYHETSEMWPALAQQRAIHRGRAWALLRLGRREEALQTFRRAERATGDDESRAEVMVKQGDILTELGREDEAMARYRDVLRDCATTITAAHLKKVVELRETERRGREAYGQYRFKEAAALFAEVAAKDPARKPRMDYYEVLCLFGQGHDGAAERRALEIVADCEDATVRAEATLWLAKMLYNRREWKMAQRLFADRAALCTDPNAAADALLWSARAAFASGDGALAIKMVTELLERAPKAPAVAPALLVQGEALIALARFDEALLVLERVALSEGVQPRDRLRAKMLKADALFALGADDSARYAAALEAYGDVRLADEADASGRITLAFKIARTLEKLKRTDEAIDAYYARVVTAYRDGRARGVRYDDEAQAAFSRAAFRLADELESRGRTFQVQRILELVAESDVPAADAAAKRLSRLTNKGRFL